MADDLVVHALMRDELTRPLQEQRREVQGLSRDMRGLSASGAAAGTQMSLLNRLFGGQTSQMRALGRELKPAHEQLLSMSRTLGRDLATGIRVTTYALGGLTAAVTVFGIKSASQFQQTRIALDGFLGSAQRGGALFRQLQQLNLRAPFQLGQITSAARQLLGFQFTGRQITPLLKSVTDVSAGLGGGADTLNRIILNLGQIQSIGKVTGRDLRDLATVGFPSYALVGNILGLTRDQVRALGDDASVSSDQFIKAVVGMQGPLQRFTGMAQKQMGSLQGQWSNLVDIFQRRLVDEANPLTRSLTHLLPEVSTMLGQVLDQVGPPIFDLVGMGVHGLSELVPIVTPVVTALLHGVGVLASSAAPALAGLGPVADQLGGSVGRFFTALAPVMPDVADAFVALVGVLPAFVDMLGAMVPLVSPIAQLVTAMLGFGPVRELVAGLLVALLGYRALASIVETLYAFARGLNAIALGQSAVAATSGAGAAAEAAGLAGGAGAVGAVGAAAPYVTAVVAGGALAFAGGYKLGSFLKHRYHINEGDPPGALPSTWNRHSRAAGMGPSSGMRVTSGYRPWGVTGPSSGHVRGTALDVAGPWVHTYAQNVRRMGGWATVHDSGSGRHAHAEYGDAAPPAMHETATGGGFGAPVTVNVWYPQTQIDYETGLEHALRRIERRRAERRIPGAPT